MRQLSTLRLGRFRRGVAFLEMEWDTGSLGWLYRR